MALAREVGELVSVLQWMTEIEFAGLKGPTILTATSSRTRSAVAVADVAGFASLRGSIEHRRGFLARWQCGQGTGPDRVRLSFLMGTPHGVAARPPRRGPLLPRGSDSGGALRLERRNHANDKRPLVNSQG